LPTPDRAAVLAVSGPEGLYLKQDCPAGSWAQFSFSDEQGRPRPDGVYKWELVIQTAGWGHDSADPSNEVRTGWFQIRAGRVIAGETLTESNPTVFEEGAPGNTIHVDSEGRVGVGTTVPRTQLHIKGADAALAIEDSHPGGHEYILRSQETGDGSLGLFDQTAGQPRWLVDSTGRIGINTTNPTATLTVDGYIETTKGFLVNGRPIGGIGLFGGTQPLATEGNFNVFFGQFAGEVTTGLYNSFFGGRAGVKNTTGQNNSFFGQNAGSSNLAGSYNSFFGQWAGYDNKDASYNTFVGYGAGWGSTEGQEVSAFGAEAGSSNWTGNNNSYFGRMAGARNTVQSNNTFLGAYTDLDPGPGSSFNLITNATAIGYRSWVTRSDSLILGGVKGFNEVTAETFVGIGTTSPDRQLVVEGSQAIGKLRRFSESGPDFGPAFLLERARGTNIVPADMWAGDYLGKVQFRGRVSGNMVEYGALAFIASDMNQHGRFSFLDRDLATERMVILNTGNVGIGTTAPTERLDVAGNLRVRGSIVYGAPAVAVPDYVFEPDYRLMPISDVEEYARREKHLPNVPKASEIEQNGVNLGELQMQLLQKVEELTLYTAEQARQIKELQETVKQLLAERSQRDK